MLRTKAGFPLSEIQKAGVEVFLISFIEKAMAICNRYASREALFLWASSRNAIFDAMLVYPPAVMQRSFIALGIETGKSL
jgi:hypothetical protein